MAVATRLSVFTVCAVRNELHIYQDSSAEGGMSQVYAACNVMNAATSSVDLIMNSFITRTGSI